MIQQFLSFYGPRILDDSSNNACCIKGTVTSGLDPDDSRKPRHKENLMTRKVDRDRRPDHWVLLDR